ncbi:MAG: pyridoxal-phosphate dependent enzyme [Myxococcales bacterium]|nr:pyridoxal-phosphate dependent enzyme [Myxococcales bacterium]
MLLGRYPTPITPLPESARAAELPAGVSLLCKRDDLTSPVYGGNKVRKLESLLDEARARGAERIVTVGAVGSHHVLACTVFGVRAGFAVDAVLAPQPWTPHVEEVVRAALGAGANVHPTSSFVTVPIALARRLASRGSAYFVPPGGSSVGGTLGYVEAAAELAAQIERKELPRPTSIVVALGSGGTAAGLLVGLERAGLLHGPEPVELVAVQVVDPPLTGATSVLALAMAVRRRLGLSIRRPSLGAMSRALRVTRAFLGDGYGHPTAEGSRAMALAARDGLVLDATYTGKAFAGALADARTRPPGATVLFWHTLSAPEPMLALLARAPEGAALPIPVRALMLGLPTAARQ